MQKILNVPGSLTKEDVLEFLEKVLSATTAGKIRWEDAFFPREVHYFKAEFCGFVIRLENGYFPGACRYGADYAKNSVRHKWVPENITLIRDREMYVLEAIKKLPLGLKLSPSKKAREFRIQNAKACKLWCNLYRLALKESTVPIWLRDG